MTTCALASAANEPARHSPADGAWLRRDAAWRALRSFSEGGVRPARCRRNGDKTLDAPVCSVSTTILVGDPRGMLLFVGNGGAFHPSVGKLYWEPAGT
jgi:hypothetical protein